MLVVDERSREPEHVWPAVPLLIVVAGIRNSGDGCSVQPGNPSRGEHPRLTHFLLLYVLNGLRLASVSHEILWEGYGPATDGLTHSQYSVVTQQPLTLR